MTRLVSISLLSVVTLALAACGASKPSSELLSARRAYANAARSKASDLAPDRLLSAEQALNRAERAHKDDGGSQKERTLAYVAERLAKLSVAHAFTLAARKEEKIASREYGDELERAERRARTRLNATRNNLGRTKADLDSARTELEQRERELAARKAALAAQEKELAAKNSALNKSKADLERERKARLAAEAKAAEALKNLQAVAAVKKEARGLVITLSGQVLFKTGKADLRSLARQRLRQVAGALMEQDEKKQIVIEGHTDSRGSDRRNRELSRSRADSVRGFLITQGVPAKRITAVGMGESQPIANNRTSEGRANNRRVEIIVK